MDLKNKRVLVTGADGFIGSHLTETLIEVCGQVRAFCFYNSNGSLGWLDELPSEKKDAIDVRLGDIRDSRFVEAACQDIDIVFNLAALIAIPYSYQAPESFIDTNIKGVLNILEAVKKQGCERLIHTSTSEVYGTPQKIPIKETDPLQGQSPYSATKIAADKLCEAYYCSFDVPVVVLRPFNTYGPRQSTRAVIPTILVQLLSGKEEVLLGNLAPKRDLTFVTDTVNGFVKAAQTAEIDGETIQLGTGITISIGELFQKACSALGVQSSVKQQQERIRPSKSEVMVLCSDPSKAKKIINWEPQTTFEQGLQKTASWIKTHLQLFNSDVYHV